MLVLILRVQKPGGFFFIIMHLKAVLKRKWNAEIIKKFEERCIIKHKLKLKFMEFFITK